MGEALPLGVAVGEGVAVCAMDPIAASTTKAPMRPLNPTTVMKIGAQDGLLVLVNVWR